MTNVVYTADGAEVYVRILETRSDYPELAEVRTSSADKRTLCAGDITTMEPWIAGVLVTLGRAEYYDPATCASELKEKLQKRRAVCVYPIRRLADYEAALGEVETLMDAAPGTQDYDRLDVLSTLVEAYESEHYPVKRPNIFERVAFRINQMLGRL